MIMMRQYVTSIELRKLISVANYQFGAHAGKILFNRGIRIAHSRKTGRIRHIYLRQRLIATLRPTDGLLALTVQGAAILLTKMKSPRNRVIVQSDVSEYIRRGGDIFAKHIVSASNSLRPAEEVLATDEEGRLIGVGSALQSGNDMKHFKRGVAIRIRHGIGKRA
jgi:predicted RNA-binding protein (TIGR00451 family)